MSGDPHEALQHAVVLHVTVHGNLRVARLCTESGAVQARSCRRGAQYVSHVRRACVSETKASGPSRADTEDRGHSGDGKQLASDSTPRVGSPQSTLSGCATEFGAHNVCVHERNTSDTSAQHCKQHDTHARVKVTHTHSTARASTGVACISLMRV